MNAAAAAVLQTAANRFGIFNPALNIFLIFKAWESATKYRRDMSITAR
jgi:hypothetical protein